MPAVIVPRWNPVGDWVSGAIGGAIEDLAMAVVDGLSQVVTTLATFWVETPTVSVTRTDGMSPSFSVAFLQAGLWSWTVSLAVLAVIIGGIRMVWERRGQPLRDILRALITLVVVSSAGLGAISLLIIAADEFSTWIIDEATAGNGFADAMKTMMIMPNGGGIAIFMIIIMGLIGICTSVIQIVLMIVRSGMLVILAGILPTTAAFSNTEMGNQWLQKTIGWTLAFILYKPAAAIVYATAFRLMDSGSDSGGQSPLLSTISGTALMVVALVALPALMRFTAPMVGAVASGAGGGMAGAGVAAAAVGALPSGARGSGSEGRGGGNAAPAPSSTGSNGRDGGQDTSGTNAASSPSGSPTAGGAGGNGAKPTPGSGPAHPGAAAGAAASSDSGAGAAATGAKAGSAAGPAGAGVGAAAATAAEAAKKGGEGVKEISDEAAGEGPSGSGQQ